MREQFDISGVFETTEFEIAKVACIDFSNTKGQLTPQSEVGPGQHSN